MSNYTIDVSQLRRLSNDLRKISPALLNDLHAGLTAAGEIVAVEARNMARFTKVDGGTAHSIADTVKTRRKSFRVKVQAGGPRAPGAAPINNRGQGGKFRHPVFGNRNVWADQDAHPFLQPARAKMYALVERQVVTTINSTLKKAGF